ncbi:hypothetical protein [Brevundimonas sp.]|uniref:hypothetical protein n=1 Tax=Brevundimonas sp. TaxID=1871086 RepID=UPI003559E648
MARRIKVNRVLAVLGGAVVLLGAVVLWRVVDTGGFEREPVVERVRGQLADYDASLALFDMIDGRTPGVVCGYAGTPGDRASAVRFVARPNRLLTSADPLPGEFRDQIEVECPGYFATVPLAGGAG